MVTAWFLVLGSALLAKTITKGKIKEYRKKPTLLWAPFKECYPGEKNQRAVWVSLSSHRSVWTGGLVCMAGGLV